MSSTNGLGVACRLRTAKDGVKESQVVDAGFHVGAFLKPYMYAADHRLWQYTPDQQLYVPGSFVPGADDQVK